MEEDKKKTALSQKQKKAMIILTIITIVLIIVGCVIGMRKTSIGRKSYIESNYNKYKQDDAWKQIEEFENYESFEDFWEHEKDDRALRYSPIHSNHYGENKVYEYNIYESQSYQYWFEVSFNHNKSFLLPCFINIGSILAGFMFIATIITFVVFRHKIKHKDDIKEEKKAKKKDTKVVSTEEPSEGEEQETRARVHRNRLVTYAPTYGILVGLLVTVLIGTAAENFVLGGILGIISGIIVYFVVKTISYSIQRKIHQKIINPLEDKIMDKIEEKKKEKNKSDK